MRFGERLAHVPVPLVACGVLLAGSAGVGWLLRGGVGAAGAAAGVGLAAASFLVSTLVVAWVDAVRPPLVLPVGLLTYAVKFTLLAVLLGVVAAQGWAGLPAVAIGIVVGAVGWGAAQIWWVVRHPPRLAYVPPAPAPAGDVSGSGQVGRYPPAGGAPYPGESA